MGVYTPFQEFFKLKKYTFPRFLSGIRKIFFLKLSSHIPRQRIPQSPLHLLQDPAEFIWQAGPDGVSDLFRDGAVEGLGDAARDAGKRVAVAAERDGQADGGAVSPKPALVRRGFRSLTAFAAEWCAAEGVQREKMGGGRLGTTASRSC